MNEISEFWIIKNSGLCLFNYSKEESINPALFSGFIAAIDNFSEGLSNERITNMKLGGNLILFEKYPDLDIIFVGRCDISTKPKKINKILDQIVQNFLSLYSYDEIKDWDGAVNHFSEFKDQIRKYFKKR